MTSNTKDNQRSFSPLDDTGKRKTTKREVFQAQMAAVVPWTALEAMIDPHAPKMGPQGGRRAGEGVTWAVNRKTGSVRADAKTSESSALAKPAASHHSPDRRGLFRGSLERFREKCAAVFPIEARQNKYLDPFSDSKKS